MTIANGSSSRRAEAETFDTDPAIALDALVGERDRALGRLDRALRALKRTASERDRAMHALAAANRRWERLLATLGHELRHPLAPIRSAVRIMRVADGDHATVCAARAILERQLHRLARLADDLVDTAHLARGTLDLRRRRVELGEILHAAVGRIRTLLESRQQHIEIDLGEDPMTLDADPERLAQVFAHLIHNGSKYSDPGAEIVIRAVRDGPEAVVTVTDRGVGIDASVLGSIFDRFATGERGARAHRDGLGIGLTLVKRLVELHGGQVTVSSDGPGRGSSFSVRMRLATAHGVADAPEPASSATAEDSQRMRILIADDSRDAAQSLALVLGLEGHEVRTAADGLEALALAERFRPRLALLDLGMAKLDGYQTARRLRGRPWGADLRLVALSGWGGDEDRRLALAAGFDRLLVKPVDPDGLEELLLAMVAKRQA